MCWLWELNPSYWWQVSVSEETYDQWNLTLLNISSADTLLSLCFAPIRIDSSNFALHRQVTAVSSSCLILMMRHIVPHKLSVSCYAWLYSDLGDHSTITTKESDILHQHVFRHRECCCDISHCFIPTFQYVFLLTINLKENNICWLSSMVYRAEKYVYFLCYVTLPLMLPLAIILAINYFKTVKFCRSVI